MTVRFPDVVVPRQELEGLTTLRLLSRVSAAMRRAGHADQIEEYASTALYPGGDRESVLAETEKWVTVQ